MTALRYRLWLIIAALAVGCSPPPPAVDVTLEGVGIGYTVSQVKAQLGTPKVDESTKTEQLFLFSSEDGFNIRATFRDDKLVMLTGQKLTIDGKAYLPGTPMDEFKTLLGEHDERKVRWAGWEQLIWNRKKTAIKVVFRKNEMASAELELI